MRKSSIWRGLVTIALVATAQPALAASCAAPGTAGSVSASGIVNSYYPANASAAAGAQSIALGAASGAVSAIAVGDLLLVIQMQDAQIDTSNSVAYGDGVGGDAFGQGYTAINQTGRFEFVRATSAVGASGGTVSVAGAGSGNGLVNAYFDAAATNTRGQRRFQVVKVPQYANVTIGGAVIASSWDGRRGGIVAIDVAGRATFAGGSLDASGAGFRGGGSISYGGGTGANTDFATLATNNVNGAKGEGVAGTPRYVNAAGVLLDTGAEGYAGGSRARGAPGNAGGGATDGRPSANDQNPGGGGGGNGGAGGKGGDAWCPSYASGNCPTSGGHPGARVAELSVSRITMGGGGGAGTTNDGTGSPGSGLATSGAAGGGIVMLRAGEIAGAASLSANGATANQSVGNDGSGGGGAGGAILVSALRMIAGASVVTIANGGNGGSNTPRNTGAHGPGGGGGGGFIATTMLASTSVSGGTRGTTENTAPQGIYYGSTNGNGGNGVSIAGAAIPGLSSGGECTPTITKDFANDNASVNQSNIVAITVTNNNPTLALTGLGFIDTYPANIVNTSTPAPARSCPTPATLSATPGGSNLSVSAATIAAASSCIYTVNTLATAPGTYTNTIPAGSITGSYGGVTVANLTAASASVTVTAPLTATKTSAIFSDPINGTSLPKAIPGAFVTYTITVTNPTATAVDANTITITDTTPAGLVMFVGDLGGFVPGPLSPFDGTPSSQLSYTYGGLGSTTDDVEFSNSGASFTYTPTLGDGFDSGVKAFRARPKGSMAPGSSFSFQVRYRIN